MHLAAPAKLNLGLRVVGRRPDGYHLIESLFLPLDLADEVSVDVEPCADARCRLELLREDGDRPPEAPSGDENLAVRAARRFLKAAGIRAEVRIGLRKRIPVGAGLGGGSSDAGAVLRGLRESFPEALSHEALLRIALELGADVPFFLDPRPAIVRGIGEQIEPIRRFPALALVLMNPGCPLETAAVYSAYDARAGSGAGATRAGPVPAGGAALLDGLDGLAAPGGLARLREAGALTNDLEPTALELCPAVADLQVRLRASGALATGMSGSGPTVFGVYPEAAAARAALASIQAASKSTKTEPSAWIRLALTAVAHD